MQISHFTSLDVSSYSSYGLRYSHNPTNFPSSVILITTYGFNIEVGIHANYIFKQIRLECDDVDDHDDDNDDQNA